MGETLMIGISTIGFVLAVTTPFIISKILKFKLEKERIRADVEIKKAEIHAKNQLDIESMMMDRNNEVKYARKSGFEREEINEAYSEQDDLRQRIRA